MDTEQLFKIKNTIEIAEDSNNKYLELVEEIKTDNEKIKDYLEEIRNLIDELKRD